LEREEIRKENKEIKDGKYRENKRKEQFNLNCSFCMAQSSWERPKIG